MKIKLAILENDKTYLERLVSAFSIKYSDKLEIYSFTNSEVVVQTVISNRVDVFLAHESFEIDRKSLPTRCAFAYLVDSIGIDSVKNEVAISKFQKADLIYKQILSLFSENNSSITGLHVDDHEDAKVIAFQAPAGGTGCSTAAAACAVSLANKNYKVLYLNLEKFGSADVFFNAEGNSDFSDIIYTIKSKKGNLSLKLESAVKQDATGVFFYSATKMALDMAELNCSEIKKLISDLKLFGGYNYIILDFDFSISKDSLELLKECNSIVLVSDGSAISNKKLERAVESLNIIEQQTEMKLLIKTGVLFNRVSSKTSQKPNLPDIKEYGGIKRYEGYQAQQMLIELSKLAVFDALA